MTLPVKRIKNMEPTAWQLFHDLARAHGLEHAAMLKWLTEEQVRREVAAPFLDRPFGGSPTPSATPHPILPPPKEEGQSAMRRATC